MKLLRVLLLSIIGFSVFNHNGISQGKNVISIDGTNFELNGKPFEFTGISFFNAIYNPEFNRSSESRRDYIKQFAGSGINVFRVWCQWDTDRKFVDAGRDNTLFYADGSLNPEHLSKLKGILKDADSMGAVVIVVLFSHATWIINRQLSDIASDKAVAELTNELKPFRNIIFQVWNEFNYRTIDYYKIIKNIDQERVVSNSPGIAGVLGSNEENRTLDYLSPHTTRNDSRHWEIAEKEIEYLLLKYNKPVVDDEPARKGTPDFGGPKHPTLPFDHILHIYNVWKAGGYIVYHHDMFQTGYGSEAVPPTGIPVPGFSEYHDLVFQFLARKDRYLKLIR